MSDLVKKESADVQTDLVELVKRGNIDHLRVKHFLRAASKKWRMG